MINVVDVDSSSIVLSHRLTPLNTPPLEKGTSVYLTLQEVLIVGNCHDQVFPLPSHPLTHLLFLHLFRHLLLMLSLLFSLSLIFLVSSSLIIFPCLQPLPSLLQSTLISSTIIFSILPFFLSLSFSLPSHYFPPTFLHKFFLSLSSSPFFL